MIIKSCSLELAVESSLYNQSTYYFWKLSSFFSPSSVNSIMALVLLDSCSCRMKSWRGGGWREPVGYVVITQVSYNIMRCMHTWIPTLYIYYYWSKWWLILLTVYGYLIYVILLVRSIHQTCLLWWYCGRWVCTLCCSTTGHLVSLCIDL